MRGWHILHGHRGQEALGFVPQPWKVSGTAGLPPDSLDSASSPTLLPHQLMSWLSFPHLLLDVGSIFLLWSPIAFLVPEILGFELLTTMVYVIFLCDFSFILSPVLSPPGVHGLAFIPRVKRFTYSGLFMWLRALGSFLGPAHSLFFAYLGLPMMYQTWCLIFYPEIILPGCL